MDINGIGATARSAFLSDQQWQGIAAALHLSDREREIARLMLEDETEWSIATRLEISRHTVHTHIERIYRKLGVTSRPQLVMRVFRQYVEMTPAAAATVAAKR